MTSGMPTPVLSAPGRAEQAAFRALLDCMARPGSIRQLAAHVRPDDGAWCAALLVAQTLIDHEVEVAILADEATVERATVTRTGSRTTSVEEADFVLASPAHASDAVRRARLGPIEAPEQSATVIVACRYLGQGPVRLELSGPGVPGTTTLAVEGVPADVFAALAERNARFPDGIDLVLAAEDGALACLPRSTSIQVIE
ncbi:MAG: phosphonate C-P lyase system protein PhnH [Dehalococcoidia bacterium]|nr:phosphonate C-P lyase system protein PhnH [Dehalococcoidia bacterium]